MSCTVSELEYTMFKNEDESIEEVKDDDNVFKGILTLNKIKLEPVSGTCVCCLSEIGLKCLFSSHYFEDKLEEYSNMIEYCFNLEIYADKSVPKEVYQICEECILRLRDAYYFKYQICASQQQLKYKLAQLKEEENLEKDKKNSYDNYLHDDELNYDSETSTTGLPTKHNKGRKKKSVEIKCKRKSKRKSKKCDKISPDTERDEKFPKNKSEKRKYKEKLPYVLEKDALVCNICDETFPLHSALVRHMPLHFPNYICDVCAKVFDSQTKLTKHVALHQAKEYKCDVCGKSYRGIDNLRSHIQRHSKFKFYKCLHCPQRFQTYHARLNHLVQIHNEEPKKYKCKQCSKIYIQGSALTRHVKRVHLQQRPFSCSVCGDGFFAKSELSDHMRKHTGVKDFKCSICLKCYGRKYTLNEHMRIHNNDKRFVCPFCDRAFTQKCTLKGHMKTHEKPLSKSDGNSSNSITL